VGKYRQAIWKNCGKKQKFKKKFKSRGEKGWGFADFIKNVGGNRVHHIQGKPRIRKKKVDLARSVRKRLRNKKRLRTRRTRAVKVQRLAGSLRTKVLKACTRKRKKMAGEEKLLVK